jgi:hypothetical protein
MILNQLPSKLLNFFQ